eukprot:5033656-Amphidinium_carterae.2
MLAFDATTCALSVVNQKAIVDSTQQEQSCMFPTLQPVAPRRSTSGRLKQGSWRIASQIGPLPFHPRAVHNRPKWKSTLPRAIPNRPTSTHCSGRKSPTEIWGCRSSLALLTVGCVGQLGA